MDTVTTIYIRSNTIIIHAVTAHNAVTADLDVMRTTCVPIVCLIAKSAYL